MLKGLNMDITGAQQKGVQQNSPHNTHDRFRFGSRHIDIHVRRLRSKLGSELRLQTIRGAGYKVSEPAGEP